MCSEVYYFWHESEDFVYERYLHDAVAAGAGTR